MSIIARLLCMHRFIAAVLPETVLQIKIADVRQSSISSSTFRHKLRRCQQRTVLPPSTVFINPGLHWPRDLSTIFLRPSNRCSPSR